MTPFFFFFYRKDHDSLINHMSITAFKSLINYKRNCIFSIIPKNLAECRFVTMSRAIWQFCHVKHYSECYKDFYIKGWLSLHILSTMVISLVKCGGQEPEFKFPERNFIYIYIYILRSGYSRISIFKNIYI